MAMVSRIVQQMWVTNRIRCSNKRSEAICDPPIPASTSSVVQPNRDVQVGLEGNEEGGCPNHEVGRH